MLYYILYYIYIYIYIHIIHYNYIYIIYILGLKWTSIINQPQMYKFNLILYLVSH